VSLLVRLFVVIDVALLSAIAIQSHGKLELRHSRDAEAQEQALALAELTSQEIKQIMEGVIHTLIELPEIETERTIGLSPGHADSVGGLAIVDLGGMWA
jgi:hypothetical protein